MTNPTTVSNLKIWIPIVILALYGCNAEKTDVKPNIIVILADDLGWSDISAYGGKHVQTTHIDAIAREGVKFTQGYATAPICGPSRAGLLTGRYQQRFGQEFQIHGIVENPFAAKPAPGGHVFAFQPENFDSVTRQGLPVNEITLAQHLKQNDYKTAIIGKWHLGYLPEFYPKARGFDHHFGFLGGSTFYTVDQSDPSVVSKPLFWEKQFDWDNRKGDRAIRENDRTVEVGEYLTDRLALEAVQFIDKNKENPFFLYIPFNAPHTPVQAPKIYFDKLSHIEDENKRTYYAMIAALDDAIGKVIDKVKESGLEENTLVFFISDNGGASYTGLTDNAPLKGGKITKFEGGVRVPYLLKWPGKLPANKVIDDPVSLLDVFPTVSSAAGVPLLTDRKYDGVDLVPHITGEADAPPHGQLFWRHGFQKAIRKGEWKLLVNEREGKVHLYNLSDNDFEENDLASSHPEQVDELKKSLDTWEAELSQPLWKSWRLGTVNVGNGEFYHMPL